MDRIKLIDCKEGDHVLVYTKSIFDQSRRINKDMIGIVESFIQDIDEDWIGMEYLSYSASIRMKGGQLIKIKDEHSHTLFRKYEFITLKELKEKYNIEIA